MEEKGRDSDAWITTTALHRWSAEAVVRAASYSLDALNMRDGFLATGSLTTRMEAG